VEIILSIYSQLLYHFIIGVPFEIHRVDAKTQNQIKLNHLFRQADTKKR